MKNLTMGIAAFLVLLLLVLNIYTIQGKSVRQEELKNGLSAAMHDAGECLKDADVYQSDAELEAAFLENFLMQTDSASDISVTVIRADHAKGIISAEAVEKYKHPNGKEGKASCVRTIILDKKNPALEEGKYQCQAVFYLNQTQEDLYKTMILEGGTVLKEPEKPEGIEGKEFVRWIDAATGKTAEFGKEITADAAYYAEWR